MCRTNTYIVVEVHWSDRTYTQKGDIVRAADEPTTLISYRDDKA